MRGKKVLRLCLTMCLLMSCLLLNGCTCTFKYDDHIRVIVHRGDGFDLGITDREFPLYYQHEKIGNMRVRELDPELAILDEHEEYNDTYKYKEFYQDLDNGKFQAAEKTETYTIYYDPVNMYHYIWVFRLEELDDDQVVVFFTNEADTEFIKKGLSHVSIKYDKELIPLIA